MLVLVDVDTASETLVVLDERWTVIREMADQVERKGVCLLLAWSNEVKSVRSESKTEVSDS